MNNVEILATTNNLALNRTKSKIIFIDPRRKRQFVVLSSMLEIVRDTVVKILGVSITDSLSTSDKSVVSAATARKLSTR
jgi:hypothetical protein